MLCQQEIIVHVNFSSPEPNAYLLPNWLSSLFGFLFSFFFYKRKGVPMCKLYTYISGKETTEISVVKSWVDF